MDGYFLLTVYGIFKTFGIPIPVSLAFDVLTTSYGSLLICLIIFHSSHLSLHFVSELLWGAIATTVTLCGNALTSETTQSFCGFGPQT